MATHEVSSTGEKVPTQPAEYALGQLVVTLTGHYEDAATGVDQFPFAD